MNARSFSFASLLLAVAQPALAQPPPVMPIQAQADQPEAPVPVDARWTTAVERGELVVRLTLVNTGDAAIDLLIKRGKLPGPWVLATVDGATLSQVYADEEMADLTSRMGPMPTFAPLAPKREILAGTFRFTLPEGYDGRPIQLEANVSSHSGTARLTTEVNGRSGV